MPPAQNLQALTIELNRLKDYIDEVEQLTGLGSWAWDVTNNEITWSDGMYLVLGLVPQVEKASYALALSHVHPDDQATYEASLAASLENGSEYLLENRIVREDKSVRNVTSRGKVIRDKEGVATRMLGTVQDVTAQKIAEQHKNEFISSMNHELRTPLTSILGALSLLQNRIFDSLPNKVAEMISLALRNARRLERLVNNLLQLTMLHEKKTETQQIIASAEELLRESVALDTPFALHHGITLALIEPIPTSHLVVNTLAFQQVMSNLISNAVKFSHSKGQVQVGARVVEDCIEIYVKDEGLGIPEALQSRVFERFITDANNATRQGGAGLGLAIAKELTTSMAGRIWFETDPTVGTSFFLAFPIAPSPTS